MKYLIIALIVFACLSFGKQSTDPCKIIQRFYYHGKLVYTLERDSISDYGCTSHYKFGYADSVVTTVK